MIIVVGGHQDRYLDPVLVLSQVHHHVLHPRLHQAGAEGPHQGSHVVRVDVGNIVSAQLPIAVNLPHHLLCHQLRALANGCCYLSHNTATTTDNLPTQANDLAISMMTRHLQPPLLVEIPEN